MIIRQNQFDVFQAQADEDFVKRLADDLVKRYAEVEIRFSNHTATVAEMPTKLLRKIVQNGIERARGYEMTWEYNIATFVSLMIDVAPNFSEHQLVKPILQNENEPPDSRMDLVTDFIPEKSWEVIEAEYDPKAWNVKFSPDEDSPIQQECLKCGNSVYIYPAANEGDTILCEMCDTLMIILNVNPMLVNRLYEELDMETDEQEYAWKEEWEKEDDSTFDYVEEN